MRISDWSSDVCASDLSPPRRRRAVRRNGACDKDAFGFSFPATVRVAAMHTCNASLSRRARLVYSPAMHLHPLISDTATLEKLCSRLARSEEHTSELKSLMRISYAVFCLKKKTIKKSTIVTI